MIRTIVIIADLAVGAVIGALVFLAA